MYKKAFYKIIIYGLASILPKIINYFLLRLFTIELNMKEYSLYTDMYSISFLIISFLTFGLETTYLRFLYKKKYETKNVFSTVMITLFIIVLLFLGISFFFIENISYIYGYNNHIEYFIMFFLIIFCDVTSSIPMITLRVNNMFIKYSLIRILNILIQTSIIIYLFFYINKLPFNFLIPLSIIKNYTNKTGYIFYSNLIASLITFISLFPIFFKIRIKNFNIYLAFEMLKYGIPIMLGTIAFSINENLDKILIKRLISDEINAAYAACYKIANFMNLYIIAFRMGIEPFFFKKSESNNAKEIYSKLTYLFIIIGIILYVLIFSNLELIAQLIIDQKYHNALSIVPIILLGNIFLGIYYNLSISYKITDNPIIGTYISLIGVIITLFFNFLLLIPNINYKISAWGTLFSYLFMLIISYIWGQKNYPIYYPKLKIIFHIFLATLIGYILFKINRIFSIIGQILYLISIFFIEKKIFIKIIKN